MNRWLKDLGLPVFAGLLAAGAALLLFPDTATTPAPQPAADDGSGVAASGPVSYADAVRRASPAVVNIYTTKLQPRPRNPLLNDPLFRRFFESTDQPQQERMQSALGSGVIVSVDGYILTSNHVVDGADQIVVLLADGRHGEAHLVGTDPETDLAVLKVDLPAVTPIPVGNPARSQVGDVVLAIGNPFGVGQTVTQGIISATGRNNLHLTTYQNFIQTDAAINPGNSGGALVDAYGNLLGINSAILDRTGFSVGIGFAIPADTAIKVLEDIVEYGRVIRGWLGIEARQLGRDAAQRIGLEPPMGLVITGIYTGGPAHQAGLLPGDVITQINEQVAGDGQASLNLIAAVEPGEPVRLGILRDGKPFTITAVAGIRPTPDQ